MKIKAKITLLYTVIVTGVLFFVCISVYYISVINQRDEAKRRLKSRSITAIQLLTEVPGINTILNNIHKKTLGRSKQQNSVCIYDNNENEIYLYADSGVVPVKANKKIFTEVEKNSEYYFQQNERDALALKYNTASKTYIIVTAANDKRGAERLAKLKTILISSWVAGILITILSGLVFSQNLLRPLRRLTKEMQDITSKNLVRRIAISNTKDEINELSATFNNLLDRLQNSFEIQKKFISNASHELFTPLTSILSELEVTLQKDRETDEYKRVINSVQQDVKALAELTKSLLEIAKANGGLEGIEITEFRIDELLMRLPAEQKKINKLNFVKLQFNYLPESESDLLVFGNAGLLFSAINNIVSNACKYSEDHVAEVLLDVCNDDFSIYVTDNGPGIKEEDRPFIFNPFYRGSNHSDKQGFGLGLSLARRILKLHKGSISILTKPADGTTFLIKIPKAKIT